MLNIQNLHVRVAEKSILKGVNLQINAGEVHVIMGPNGAGKSTLAATLAGQPDCEVTQGSVQFNDKALLTLAPEERAGEGLFLAFQYPVALPGVRTSNFLKTALNAIRKYRGEDPLHAVDFIKYCQVQQEKLKIAASLLQRALNDGFSGGEKKRLEVLQMALLSPRLAILDETDSGLDVDALRIVGEGVTTLRQPYNATLIITHYPRLLRYVVPNQVHILMDGQVVCSGDHTLVQQIERQGYDGISFS